MSKIITVTMNPSIDMNTTASLVEANQKIYCSQPKQEPGGGGINVSRAIKILGGTSLACFTLGGHRGQHLYELLQAQDIPTHPITIQQETRENWMIQDKKLGQQYRFGLPGPDLTESEWQHALKWLTQSCPPPDYMILSGSLPPSVPIDFYGRIIHAFKHQSTRVILDTHGEALNAGLHEKGTFLFKPDKAEQEALASHPLSTIQERLDFAQHIIDEGQSETIMMTMAAEGAWLMTQNLQLEVPSPGVPLVSAIGAGDSLIGALVMHLSQGDKLSDAACWGVAAATSAVTTPGTELCRFQDTKKYHQQILEIMTSKQQLQNHS